MEPSGFDYVAAQISLYRDLLLAVPHWVKNQAFDIHISRGMPLSICGREGTLFPTKSGEVSRVPEQGVVAGDAQLRELFFASLRAFGFPPRRGAPAGVHMDGRELPGWGLRQRCDREGGPSKPSGRSPPWCTASPGIFLDAGTGCSWRTWGGRGGILVTGPAFPVGKPLFCGMWPVPFPGGGLAPAVVWR